MAQMRKSIADRRLAAPLALCLVAFLLSFWQRPHTLYADTRIELLTNPGLFLSRVGQMWTSTVDLGHMGASQFVGYLFPMGPFFWLGDVVGLPTWIVQRLWIFVLLAIAAWGAVRLVEAVRPAAGSSAGFIAGLVYITCPFVVVSFTRGTGWLVALAFLPWLLLLTQRGLRSPTAWPIPATIALMVVTVAGGAGNAALLFWVLVGVVLLGIFEALTDTGWRALCSLAWRSAALTLVASLWWIVPTVAQARYGANYLAYTEHAEAILHTASASESLRTLGYWLSYSSTYPNPEAQFPSMISYLLSLPTILATFIVPFAALAAVVAFPRWRYAAFFALLLGLAVLAMSAGFPVSNRIGAAVVDLYYQAGPLQFIRTTYKAAPLAAIATAVLAGVGLGTLFDRVRTMRLLINDRSRSTLPLMGFIALVLLVLLVSWGRPLWSGNAITPRLALRAVPAAWTDAVANAQTTTPAGTRTAVLPGELYGAYRWGEIQNSVAPALSERPVLVHQVDRLAADQAAQLLEGVDQRVQQGRLTPGQLPPLLQLMGVGRVLVGTDSSPIGSETLDPARASQQFQRQQGFAAPVATFGPVRTFTPPGDRGGFPVKLPQVRAYAAPVPALPRINRVHSAERPLVLDGDADGVISLAGVGALDPQRAAFYAADLSEGDFDRLLADNPTLSFTDSNRRRTLLSSKLFDDRGPVMGANEPLNRIFPDYNPFASRGAQSRTVAVYSGLSGLYAPSSAGFALSPDHRPYAALDRQLNTSWLTQEEDPAKRFIELDFKRPTDLPWIGLRPHNDQGAVTKTVLISVNGGPERRFTMRRGWNRIAIRAVAAKRLRLRVPGRMTFFGPSANGFDEIRIPRLRVVEALRMPTVLASLADGRKLNHSPLEVVAERATADFPRRTGRPLGPASNISPLDVTDAESEIRRVVRLPVSRRFLASGWGSVSDSASDGALDRISGLRSGDRFSSSSRFEGVPINRASSAFDREPLTAWRAEYASTNRPWIQWTGQRAIQLRRLRIVQLPGDFLRATRVNVATSTGGFDLPVEANGWVTLPTQVSTKRVRVTILGVAKTGRLRPGQKRTRTVAVSRLELPEVATVAPRRAGAFSSACGAASVSSSGSTTQLSFSGDLRDLDSGSQLYLRSCPASSELGLHKGSNLFVASSGPVFTVDSLRLASPAPSPIATTATPASLSPSGRVTLRGPGWLVLGQSYSPGWRAQCTDRSGNSSDLGEPRQIDGFANGWRINGSACAQASFRFGPQRAANIAYVISGLAMLLLLAISLVGWRARTRNLAAVAPKAEPTAELSLSTGGEFRVALTPAGEADGAPGRPRAAGWLYGLAAVAVLALPLIYLFNPDPNPTAINFDYPLHHIGAHWVAVAAMLLLVGGAVVEVVTRRLRR